MNQEPVCVCGEELNQSIVFKDDDVKSCPNCSVEAGRHVFYTYEDFGYRLDGKYVQSWCTACRSHEAKTTPFMEC